MRFIVDRLRSRVRGGLETFFAVLVAVVTMVLLWVPPADAQDAPDLSITKEGPERVEPGEQFDYDLTVSNRDGAETATPVTVEDELPPGVTFDESDPNTCTDGGDTDNDGRVDVICTVQSLAGGQSRTITLTVTAPAQPGDIRNRARASAGNDPDSTETSDRVTTRVAPNLVIGKLDDPDPVGPGERLIYTLRVENQSDTQANGIRIRDDLPINVLDFISVDSNDFDCDYRGGGLVLCTGTIAPNEAGTVTIIVEPEETGTIRNTAEVRIDGISEPIDEDTERTTVETEDDPNPDPDPSPAPGPTPNPGNGCSPVVDNDTEEPVGVLRGTEDLLFGYTNDTGRRLPLRIVYATSSADGTLSVTVTPEGGDGAILEETITGAENGVLRVNTQANTSYDVEVLPEDQGYAVLFEVGRGSEECTNPESLDPIAVPSDDEDDDDGDDDDILTGTIPDEDLPDTGGLPLSVLTGFAALLLLVTYLTGAAVVKRGQ